MALTDPDEYAWRVFFFLNRQAKPGTAGEADERKPFGQLDSQAPLVWETWALSSGHEKSEVFKPDGMPPTPWEKLDRSQHRLELDKNIEGEMVNLALQEARAEALRRDLKTERRLRKGPVKAQSVFIPPTDDDRQEVRMNRCTFEFITRRQMYNVEGLENLLAQAKKTSNRALISLAACSKEVKAEWLPIDPSQKSRYVWREAESEGKKQIWGLVGLHIITKDLPNWFWADFGHIDCESQLNACSRQPVAAITVPVDSTTGGPNRGGPEGGRGIRRETLGTVWENYILRGTETNFTTATGSAQVLSNPVIEARFQESSCITCHARAGVGARQQSQGVLVPGIHQLAQPIGKDLVGIPEPSLFGDEPDTANDNSSGFGRRSFTVLQTDFMWSPIIRACRRNK